MGGQRGSIASQDPEAAEPEECQERDMLNTFQDDPPTMYQWARWKNCKTSKVYQQETYPIIRPPISKCGDHLTLGYIDDALEANKCGRLFDMGKDDILAVWNDSPRKETLSCYGIDGGIPSPEAIRFNRIMAKSLRVASRVPKPPKPYVKPDRTWRKKVPDPSGPYVLDRDCLKMKLDKMPNVLRQLKAENAFTWLHCPPPANLEHPFEDDGGHPTISLTQVLDMEKPPKPPKKQKKYFYCPMDCGEPQNKCTTYEWAKYKMDPRPYDEEFKREMDAYKEPKEPEPRNYDELYKALVPCFVQQQDGNDMCEAYEKCCKDPKDPPTVGCGEFGPEGAGGDGKSGDAKADDDDHKDGKRRSSSDRKRGDDEDDGGRKRGRKDKDKDGGDGDGGDGKEKVVKEKGDGGGDRDKGKGKVKEKKEKPKKEDKIPEPEPLPEKPEEPVKDEEKKDGYKKPPREPAKSIDDGDTKDKPKVEKKKKKKKVKKDKDKKDKDKSEAGDGDGVKDCPCEICCQTTKEEDTPLIKEMRRLDKERILKEYLRRMRHRQYMECREPVYPAPPHKCDPIECNTAFCGNNRMQKHFERVQALQQVEKDLLGRNQEGDTKIVKNLNCLLRRLCNRLTQGGYCG